MSLVTQIVILLIILTCMVIILLGIRQLSHFEGFEDSNETVHLKEDIEERGNILSRNNIFSNLVETDIEDQEENKFYKPKSKSNSKEPLSRRE